PRLRGHGAVEDGRRLNRGDFAGRQCVRWVRTLRAHRHGWIGPPSSSHAPEHETEHERHRPDGGPRLRHCSHRSGRLPLDGAGDTMPALSSILTLGIFIGTLALIVARPRGWNEAWWATLGAVAMIALRLVTPAQAFEMVWVSRNAVLFLLALLLLSALL